MPETKKFTCASFQTLPCNFECEGEEQEVIQQAVDHLVEVHGYSDSIQLRQQISQSLT